MGDRLTVLWIRARMMFMRIAGCRHLHTMQLVLQARKGCLDCGRCDVELSDLELRRWMLDTPRREAALDQAWRCLLSQPPEPR